MIRVASEDYLKVKNNLNHGQPSQLGRLFLKSLGQLIDDNQRTAIMAYLIGDADLTLPKAKIDDIYG